MNKHLHRIIFNKVRGLFMAVQETASSAGGSAKSTAQTLALAGTAKGPLTAPLNGVRFAVLVALGMVSAMSPLAQAQIVADPAAAGNQRPIVLNTANGLPLVNIQTPSAAGVSRNLYNQFDVQAGGAVLNNSRSNVQTQLGGFVQGNPYLATGSARVILNEVNSSNPSQLRGYVEVAGQRAEVIIANPAGINIDGGGFINASRVTLTTGTPILSGGSIDSYRVQRGSIFIVGAGLDTSTADYTGILARAVQANAGIWAKDLKVVTGANDVDATQTTVTPIAGTSAAPSFALDVAQLGGMYANHIFLIGTEAGVGVRNAGVIGATAGDVVLQANGWLTNSGTLQGQSDATLQATGVTNSGHVVAGQTLTIATAGALDNSGGTLTAPRLDVTAASLLNRGGVIEQTGSQALLLQSQSLSNGEGGQIGAASPPATPSAPSAPSTTTPTTPTDPAATTSAPITTTATITPTIAITPPVALADGQLHISGALSNNAGRINAAGGMDLTSQNGLNNDAGTLYLRQLTVSGGNVSNQGGTLLTSGDMRLLSEQLNNQDGHLTAAGQLQINATGLNNLRGEIIQTGTGDTVVNVGSGALDNTSGRIATNAYNLTLTAGALTNTDGHIEYAGTGLLAIMAGIFDGARGSVNSNGAIALNAGNITLDGGTLVARQLAVHSGGVLSNRGGTIQQAGTSANSAAADISAATRIDNTAGQILSNGDVVLATASLDNTDGAVVAANHLSVVGDSVVNTRGTLQATGGNTTLSAGNLQNNAGSVYAGQNLVMQATDVGNTGSLYAGANLSLQATGHVINSGTISAQGNTTINALTLTDSAASVLGAGIQSDGTLAGSGNLSVATLGSLSAAGHNLAAGTAAFTGEAVDLSNSQTAAASIDLLARTGDVTTSRAVVSTPGALSIGASHGALVNTGGTLSANQLLLNVVDLSNQGGVILQTGNTDLGIQVSGTLDNSQGRIATNSDRLTLAATTLNNTEGRIEHAGTGGLQITAQTLNGQRGHITSNGALRVDAGAFDHLGGTLVAQRVGITAASLNNHLGQLIQTGTGPASIAVSGALDNSLGLIASGGAMTLAAQSLNNQGGIVQTAANADLNVAMAGALDNSAKGVISSGRELTLSAQSLNNQAGVVQSGATADLNLAIAGQLDNSAKGAISAGHNATLTTAQLINDLGRLTAGGTLAITASQSATNLGGLLASNDALTVQAGALDNTGGTIVSVGDRLAITTTGALTNDAGRLQALLDLELTSAALNNAVGSISGRNVTIDTAGGALNNALGTIGASGAATLHTGALDNTGGLIQSAGNLSLDTHGHTLLNADAARYTTGLGGISSGGSLTLATGELNNTRGFLAAQGAVTAVTGSFDNTAGTLASVKNQISLTSSGAVTNDGGHLQALNDVSLSTGALSNARGTITGANLFINTRGADLNNAGGTLAASQNATLHTGAFNNDAGLVQTGGDLTFDTSTQALTNTHAAAYANAQGGISSQGALTLTTGALDNSAGFLGAKGALVATTGQVHNLAGGIIAGQSSVNFTSTGFDNQAGQIQALGDVAVNVGAGTLNNDSGLVRSGGSTTLAAGALVNTHTAGADQGIEGHDIRINAASIVNDHGAVRADHDASLSSAGSLTNVAGLVSAGNALTLQAGAITSTAGVLIGGKSVSLTAGSLGGDGRLLSQGDMTVNLTGNLNNFNNTGEVIANGDLSFTAAGNIDNSGKFQAGNVLALVASDINNSATGEISGATTRVTATGTLTNRGLIDGQTTEIHAGTLNNIGTGRIYGDQLSIQAGTVNNSAETIGAVTRAATIAARERLDIAAGTLNNTGGALIFSAGSGASALNIGGALDGHGQATGAAGTVTNTASIIESSGGMSIYARRILNSNDTAGYTLSSGPATQNTDFIADNGSVYHASDFGWQSGGVPYKPLYYQAPGTPYFGGVYIPNALQNGGQLLSSPYADPIYQQYYEGPDAHRAGFTVHPIGRPAGDTLFDTHVPETWAYDSTSGIWDVFGVPRPLPEPSFVVNGQPDPDYSAKLAAYQADRYKWDLLQAKLDAFRAVVKSYMITVKTYRDYTETSQTVQVDPGHPGQILSAGDMTLNATELLLNDRSKIIAGGMLRVTGAAVDNHAADISVPSQRSGTLSSWAIDHWQTSAYAQEVPKTLTLPMGQVLSLTVPAGTGTQVGTETLNGTNVVIGSASAALANVAPGAIAKGSDLHEMPISHIGLTTTPGTGSQVPSSPTAGTDVTAAPVSGASANVTGGAAQVAVNTSAVSGGTLVVRTVPPAFTLPTASLYNINTVPTGHYLVETEPRFASYRNWLGSDYLLDALGLDPNATQKRLGDGFYEQRLVREQVAQLTGQRFLSDYTSDEQEYRALMDAGATYARAWNLVPGIALTATQMAQLTSDIVWLVAQTVTLANGSTQRVLVPQVYVRVQPGDLDGVGSLLAGRSVDIRTTGDLTNSGTIAGRQVVSLSAANVQNLGGRVTGSDVSVSARNDLNNIGGSITAANSLYATAGHNINIVSTTAGASSSAGQGNYSYQGVERVAGLYVTNPGGVLVASAENNLNVIGANIVSAGTSRLDAGHDVNLGTVKTAEVNDVTWDARNDAHFGQSADVGSNVTSAGNLTLHSGNNLNAVAATINSSTGAVFGSAGGAITLDAGRSTHSLATGAYVEDNGFLSSSSTEQRNLSAADNSVGTSVGGNTVTLLGDNITVSGSSVIGDTATTLIARNNLNIVSATNTQTGSSFNEHTESGFLDGGGIGITIGTRQQSTAIKDRSTTAAASTVGSIGGNVTLLAGNTYTQTGSDVMAPDGNIVIRASNVAITEARETSNSQTETRSRQSGLTLEITSPVLSAAQSVMQSMDAAGDTRDSRMQLLAAANAGFAVNNAMGAIQAGQGQTINGQAGQIVTGKNPDGTAQTRDANDAERAGGVNVAISYGSSSSQTNSQSQSDTARGSTIKAGGNVSIAATGGGGQSNLLIQGSDVTAGGNVALSADNNVTLGAAENTAGQHTSNRSSSGSLGVSFGTDGFLVNASASRGRGRADGDDVSYINSHVTAGDHLAITSGGDTTLAGAVASANQVDMTVGGNLNIQSLQDTSTYTSQQSSVGGSVSVGLGNMSGSLSMSNSRINSSYASVGEQTGIRAGDGGFNVNVGGATTLTGGVITSTDAAVTAGHNSYAAAGGTTVTDLQNTANYQGSSTGFSVGGGASAATSGMSGLGVGLGHDSGQANSTTSGGISGIAGNTAVRTGDQETGIAPIFDSARVQREITAQVTITQTFTRQFGLVAAQVVTGWLSTMGATTETPSVANPTPAADRLVRSDQDIRAGLTALQNDSSLDVNARLFFQDFSAIYTGDGYLQGLVHNATADPAGYQQSVTPPSDSLLSDDDRSGYVSAGLYSAATAGAAQTAGAAAASLAGGVSRSGVTYDPVTDTFTSASGGSVTGAVIRALSGLGGAVDAATSAFIKGLRTSNPTAAAALTLFSSVVTNLLPSSTGNQTTLPTYGLGNTGNQSALPAYDPSTTVSPQTTPPNGAIVDGSLIPSPLASGITTTPAANPIASNLVMSETYDPTPKHAAGGWGTPMDLSDADAQQLLNTSTPIGKQRYGYTGGQLYEFQPDNAGAWHGYSIPGNEAPPSWLRSLRDNGTITNSQYGRMVRGK